MTCNETCIHIAFRIGCRLACMVWLRTTKRICVTPLCGQDKRHCTAQGWAAVCVEVPRCRDGECLSLFRLSGEDVLLFDVVRHLNSHLWELGMWALVEWGSHVSRGRGGGAVAGDRSISVVGRGQLYLSTDSDRTAELEKEKRGANERRWRSGRNELQVGPSTDPSSSGGAVRAAVEASSERVEVGSIRLVACIFVFPGRQAARGEMNNGTVRGAGSLHRCVGVGRIVHRRACKLGKLCADIEGSMQVGSGGNECVLDTNLFPCA